MFQNQAYFNALSLFTNTLILLIISLFESKLQKTYLLIFSSLLMLTKIALAQILPLQISYFNNPKYSANKSFLWKNITQDDQDEETYFSDQDSNDLGQSSSQPNAYEEAHQFTGGTNIESSEITPKGGIPSSKKPSSGKITNAIKKLRRQKTSTVSSNYQRGVSQDQIDQYTGQSLDQ